MTSIPLLALLDFSNHRSSVFGKTYYNWPIQDNGPSFSEFFIERCLTIEPVDKWLAIVHPDFTDIIDQLSKYEIIQIVQLPKDEEIFLFYNDHDKVLKSRKWAYQSIIGGAHDTSIYDELLPTEIIKQIVEQIKCESILHLHPEMPFLNTEYASHLISEYKKSDGKIKDLPALIYPSEVGRSPFFLTKAGLNYILKQNLSPAHALRQGKGFRGIFNVREEVHVDMDVKYKRESFLLRSERDLEKLRYIYQKCRERNIDINSDLSTLLKENKYTEPLPKEIDIECTSIFYEPELSIPKLDNCTEEIPIDTLERVLKEVSVWEDTLVTLGDITDLLSHSKLDAIAETLKQHKPFGLQLTMNANHLVDYFNKINPFLNISTDIINLCLTPLSYREGFELKDFEPILIEFLKRIDAAGDFPIIHLTLHKRAEKWTDFHLVHQWAKKYHLSCNWVPYNHYAKQISISDTMPVYTPRNRYACEKQRFQMYILPNGDVPMCKQDIHSTKVYGNVEDTSIESIWNSTDMADDRKSGYSLHQLNSLCNNCSNWLHC